jgi:hypothetical protein
MKPSSTDILAMMKAANLWSMTRSELEAEIERIESGSLPDLYLSRCTVEACRALLDSRVFGQPIK